MSNFWQTKAKEQPTQGRSPKLSEGQHRVAITKLVFGSKAGGFFQNNEGDRQIMVIVANDKEQEATSMFTLNEKYGWAMAQLCEACGMDLAKMDSAGIGIDKFTDEAWATKQLIGTTRTLDVEVEHSKDGKYVNFRPLRPEGTSQVGGANEEIEF